MIKKLLLITTISLVIILMGCNKKSDNPTEPSDWFSFDIKLNKTYTYKIWDLDTLNRRVEPGEFIYSKFIGKDLNYGGYNDVYLMNDFYSQDNPYTKYIRVENKKDVYEWQDTSFFYEKHSDIKNILKKIIQYYTWVPICLLSKGTGVEYNIIPQKTYVISSIKVNVEILAKNDGFENITIQIGNVKTYRVKQTLIMKFFSPDNQLLDRIEANMYYWISDEYDWIVKEYFPTVKSEKFGVFSTGYEKELVGVQ